MALKYYRALISKDDDATDYGVVFPDFPGCVSAAGTVQLAATGAAEALGMHVEGMVEAGMEIPEPSELKAHLPDWLGNVPGETVAILVPVEMPGRVVRANITFDEGLLARVDRAASKEGFTRSGYLAQAARERLAKVAA